MITPLMTRTTQLITKTGREAERKLRKNKHEREQQRTLRKILECTEVTQKGTERPTSKISKI